jgi:hypothetical protein
MRMNRARRFLASACSALFVCGICGLGGGMARADERPLARVVLMPELIPSVVGQLVPIAIEVPAGGLGPHAIKVKIGGLVYCGSDGQHGAWALGAAYPDSAAPASNVLTTSDCQAPLPEVARRLAHAAGAFDWVEVINAHVTWTPWTLRFMVADAAGAGKSGNPAPSPGKFQQFLRFPTSNLHILPPPGQENRFDVAVGFLESSIVVALFPAGRVGNPARYLKGDPVLDAEMADAPHRANAVADAQYGFINALLRLYASSFEIPLQLQGTTQSLVARNLSASGGDNTMTVEGQIDLGNISYNAAVHCKGDDLAIRQVTLASPARDCNTGDVVERLQCQGQQAAGGVLSETLTNTYQGQKFHYSTIDRPLRFTLGDADFAARFEALKSSSHGSTVSEDGNVTIQRINRAGAPER